MANHSCYLVHVVRYVLLIVLLGGASIVSAQTTTDGALRMEVIKAYNFVVDSNVETPASYSPSAAHLGVKIVNTGSVTLTNIVVNMGDLIDPLTSSGTPGIFPSRTVTVGGSQGYSGTFALQMPGGAADAVRAIPSLAPGQSVVQYFFITYPLKDPAGNSVAGAAPDPNDDLWLNYDIWATAQEGGTTRRVGEVSKATMRNEISAMANKIWPNTTGKVPDEYLDAIEASLGWRPNSSSPQAGSNAQLEGIWYDLGNVGAGFDNNGDGIPDRNAWMQPVGDPARFDPLAMRLVKCYGIVIVKLNDGTEQLIPFEDKLYFENLPANNTGAVGLVFYEFLPLSSGRTATMSPYQEVASGFDNEKFNGDYGASSVSVTSSSPSVTFNKAGPALVTGGSNASYSMTATNSGSSGLGIPLQGLPFVFEDAVPTGLVYVANSATAANTIPAGNSVTVSWSTDNGATWVTTEPSAISVKRIRWTLNSALAPASTATVGFQAAVPVGFAAVSVDNTAVIKLGSTGSLATSTATSRVTGNNSIGDLIWKDDNRDSIKGAGETGIPNITVNLYYDANGNGAVDSSESIYGTTQTNASGIYSFSSLPDGNFVAVVDYADADLPFGYSLPNSASPSIAAALDPTRASATAVNFMTADWPFIPALAVVKSTTPSSYGAGSLINYTIDLENYAAPVAAKTNPVQSAWSTTVTGKNGAQKPANAQGEPDNAFARLNPRASADELTASGFTFANPTGAITKVEMIFQANVSQPFVEDQMDVSINGAIFTTLTTAQLNTMTDPSAIRAVDITLLNATWTWASVQALIGNLKTNKTSSGDYSVLWVDSIGFRVTTVAAPPSVGTYGPSTIDPLPLLDTYDATKLQYISASVAPTSISAGTLSWSNLGPLNAGTRKTITVTFRALTPPDSNANGEPDPTTTINTATSTGAYFVSGRPTNPATGTATVTINPRGFIGDLIWWDLNANGTKDVSEPGLANVLVTLDNGAQTRTDSTGYYLFSNLADGTYIVTVDTATLPWTTFTQTKDPDLAPGVILGDNASTGTINNNDGLSTNNSYLDRDFGYDSLFNVISGMVFRDSNGNGVQDSGEIALAGVTVTLSGPSGATITTDSSGYYSFGSLANGTYTVTVTQPAGTTQTLDPDATINNATTKTVSGGNLYPNNNFAYRPTGTLTLGDTLYIDWNGNGLQDTGEEGITGVDVTLYLDTAGNGEIDPADDPVSAVSVTNSSGAYGFNGLPAGNYIVVVNTADPQFPAGVIQIQDFDGTRDSRAVVNLTVSLATVDFGYKPKGTASIGDTVFLDTDGDGVKDPIETGIANVGVTLYEDNNNNGVIDAATDAIVASTTTNSSGTYLFSGLAAGNYLVDVNEASASIPNDAYGNKYRRTATDPHDVTLAADQAYLAADFGFAAAANIGDFVFFDANGNATQDFSETGITNVTVQLFLDANQDGQPDSPTPVATTTTATGSGANPAGFYQFTNLAAGTYFVKVLTSSLPQAGGQPIPLTADPDRDGVPVNDNTYPGLPAGDNADSLVIVSLGGNYTGADFGYRPPGSIGDFVWLDLDQDGVKDAGEPGVSGVTVRITNGTTTYNTTTDFDGYWSAANIPDGAWTVSVPASNFSSGAALEGTAATYDADGGLNSSVAIVLANGNVNLPVGNLGLDFGYKLNGAYSLSGTVVTHDTRGVGAADDLDDFFDDGADQDAGPLDETELSGVVVYLYNIGGDYLGSTTTDEAGNYRFSGLPAGTYRVIIGALVNSTLTTTTANNPAVSSVNSSSGTSVFQTLAITTASVNNVDFAFISNANFDYGDLPFEYGMTTLDQDGARHIIPSGGTTVYLGGAPDADTNGVSSTLANGDDSLGTDDENGIVPLSITSWTNGASGGSIQATVTGSGWLVGWIDWNHDGDFLDSDEFVVSQAVATGTSTITLAIPAGTIGTGSESWLSRFRIFTTQPAYPLFSYTGSTTNGEVEDYLIEKPVGASIGDIVWNDTNGNGVLNVGEEGIGEITVVLRNDSNAIIGTQVTGNGTVDVDGDGVIDPVGFYRFRGLVAGNYTVTVPTVPAGFTLSYDENGVGTPNTTSFSLASGVQHLTADFGYAPLVANISGQVRYDTDSDADFSDPDNGAAVVKIQLWTDPNGDGNPADGEQAAETYTNATGNYIFTSVPTGKYTVVEINLPGSNSTADVVGINDDRIAVVMTGSNVDGRDFLDTPPPVYVISGKVYDDANASNNNVIGADDTPLASIIVKLFLDRDANGVVSAGDSELSSVVTNGSGAYSFTGIPAGNYIVQETDPAGATSDWDAAGDLTDNQVGVAVVNANITNRDFLDDGYLCSIGDLVFNDTNANGVRDGGETGLAGVIVSLYRPGFGPDGIANNSDDATAVANQTTPAGGAYSFINLLPGTYQVGFGNLTGYGRTLADQEADDNVDSDANAGTGRTGNYVLAAGASNIIVDAGYFQSARIGDLVFNDTNANGVLDGGETGLAGVIVSVYRPGFGPDGIAGNGDDALAVASQTTPASGAYSFTGLRPGTYQVGFGTLAGYSRSLADQGSDTTDSDANASTGQTGNYVLAPGASNTSIDAGYYQPGSIGNLVWSDSDHNGRYDSGEPVLSGIEVRLYASTQTPGVDNPLATAVTNGSGIYDFSNIVPGNYVVYLPTPPVGTPGVSGVHGSGDDQIDNDNNGSQAVLGGPVTSPVIALSAGEHESTIDFAFACQGTWEEWQYLNPLGGQNQPANNPDGDEYDNLVEFAFNQPATSGAGDPWMIRPSTNTVGTIEAVFTRPEGAALNVTYSLQYASTVDATTTWTTIAITPDMMTVEEDENCIETVIIKNLETLTGLTGGQGFVRIRADLDAEVNHTSYTEVEGWTETSFGICGRTFNNPYLSGTEFTGTVDSVGGQTLDFTTSAGTVDLASLLEPGAAYFLEVTSGDNEGQRFDIVSASGSVVTLAADTDVCAGTPPFNTLVGALPASLTGDHVMIQRHRLLGDWFPATDFFAAEIHTDSDQIQTFAKGVWTTYWLYTNGGSPKWVKVGDTDMVDQAATALPPGQGSFVLRRNSGISIQVYGEVRVNDFVNPLEAGTNLTAGGYPLDQSATGIGSRAMNLGTGFFGSRDFKTADSFFVWKGDTVAGTNGYDTYFLLNRDTVTPAQIKWVKQGDVTLVSRDAAKLLLGNASVFLRVKNDLHSYTVPSPWNP